jgi:hypothetical protein
MTKSIPVALRETLGVDFIGLNNFAAEVRPAVR